MIRERIIEIVTEFFTEQEARLTEEKTRLIQSLLDLEAAEANGGHRLQTIQQATGTFRRDYRTVARNARQFGALVYQGDQPLVDRILYQQGLEARRANRRKRRRKTPKVPNDSATEIRNHPAHGQAPNQATTKPKAEVDPA